MQKSHLAFVQSITDLFPKIHLMKKYGKINLRIVHITGVRQEIETGFVIRIGHNIAYCLNRVTCGEVPTSLDENTCVFWNDAVLVFYGQ
jgi:hypothetical protein